MSQYYFSESGGYGDRDDMTEDTEWTMIIPTGHWSVGMWDLVKECDDNVRYNMAKHFSINIHEISKGVCKECKLPVEHLQGQYLRGIDPELQVEYGDWATDAWTIKDENE